MGERDGDNFDFIHETGGDVEDNDDRNGLYELFGFVERSPV